MDINNLKEEKLTSELIYDGVVVHLYRDEIMLPNKKESVREYVKHVGAVCVVPVTSEGNIICVKQYRYPFSDILLEIPAGKLDNREEDPYTAALRELREETGAICKELIPLGKYYSSPAILDECIHMYLAINLEFGNTDPDDDEFLDVVSIPAKELERMIYAGEISDGKTQVAVLKALYTLRENKKSFSLEK